MNSAQKNSNHLPKIILVLGMHRSGTSLIAQLIAKWGAYMGNDLMHASKFNLDGYWEHNPLVKFHDKLLEKTNKKWFAPSEEINNNKLLNEYGDEARQLVEQMDHGGRIWCWNSELISIKKSYTYRFSRLLESPLLLFRPFKLKELIKGKLILFRNIKLLKQSSYFDTDYYMKNNPDVKQTEKSAIRHYLLYGGFEGRKPSGKFDSASYLAENPDIKATGMNPLVHYLLHGKREGRQPLYREPRSVHTIDPGIVEILIH